ncbi:MAG: hydrogenase/urease accessory protein HupE [Candidatus Azotimanducaceae bacterium]
MKRQEFRIFTLLLLLLNAMLAIAHDGRPVYLELTQVTTSDYELAWRLPPTLDQMNLPQINLAGGCQETSTVGVQMGLLGKRLYRCSSEARLAISLNYPRTNPSLSSIVRIAPLNLPAKVEHAGPGITLIKIPDGVDSNSVLTEYGRLGIEHILRGFDHLLFLVCVVWLAFTARRIFLAITGFTIAHSVTLGLAALEIITPAIEPTEALIALSIVFIAAELARQKKSSLSWRFPVAVSSIFGLLHGLGFASVLKEIGLPTNDSLLALFAFNVGVEVGQLLFISGLLAGVLLLRKVSHNRIALTGARSQLASGYVVGVLAAFWFFQRLVGMV